MILSPTPPVECLSTVGLERLEKSSRSPELIMARVQRSSSRRLSPRNITAMARVAICSSAISSAVYAAISQSI